MTLTTIECSQPGEAYTLFATGPRLKVHLAGPGELGGTGACICGFDRHARDENGRYLVGFSVGGGTTGPGINHEVCADCARLAGDSQIGGTHAGLFVVDNAAIEIEAAGPRPRCTDLTRGPRGSLRCVLDQNHEVDPLSMHEIDLGATRVPNAPRPSTPPEDLDSGGQKFTVKRRCNGCDRELGDVTHVELDAAITGAELPDVRVECGCLAVQP